MSKKPSDASYDRISRSILAAFALVIVVLAVLAVGYFSRHTFSARRWKENDDVRKYMVADLLKKHALVGVSEQDVVELLGPETGQQATFKGDHNYYPPDSTIVYYMGQDLLEGEWLILPLKNGAVEKVVFGLT